MAQNIPKEIVNRKARHEYQFVDKYEAGIVLTGTEVKSIRQGKANLNDAYCHFDKKGNLQILSMYIAPYDHGSIYNHEERRTRRLLLNKNELRKMEKALVEKSMTVIPYKIYFNERGFIKIEIWTAQGKKAYDKRQSIKERETKRRLDRVMKEY